MLDKVPISWAYRPWKGIGKELEIYSTFKVKPLLGNKQGFNFLKLKVTSLIIFNIFMKKPILHSTQEEKKLSNLFNYSYDKNRLRYHKKRK